MDRVEYRVYIIKKIEKEDRKRREEKKHANNQHDNGQESLPRESSPKSARETPEKSGLPLRGELEVADSAAYAAQAILLQLGPIKASARSLFTAQFIHLILCSLPSLILLLEKTLLAAIISISALCQNIHNSARRLLLMSKAQLS